MYVHMPNSHTNTLGKRKHSSVKWYYTRMYIKGIGDNMSWKVFTSLAEKLLKVRETNLLNWSYFPLQKLRFYGVVSNLRGPIDFWSHISTSYAPQLNIFVTGPANINHLSAKISDFSYLIYHNLWTIYTITQQNLCHYCKI